MIAIGGKYFFRDKTSTFHVEPNGVNYNLLNSLCVVSKFRVVRKSWHGEAYELGEEKTVVYAEFSVSNARWFSLHHHKDWMSLPCSVETGKNLSSGQVISLFEDLDHPSNLTLVIMVSFPRRFLFIFSFFFSFSEICFLCLWFLFSFFFFFFFCFFCS